MSKLKSGLSKLAGWVVGGGLLAAGLAAVIWVRREAPVEHEPLPVRPVKVVEVGKLEGASVRIYPGIVKAGQEVVASFEVSGRIIEMPFNKSDQVKAGDVLARLDARDYENELEAALAEQKRAQAQRDRMAEAAKLNAVSQQELTNAEAALEAAIADVNIRRKAVEDSELRARFDAVIADRYEDNFTVVLARQPVYLLGDISVLDIEVNLPEQRIAMTRNSPPAEREKPRAYALFDFRPGERFDVTLKEFTVQADATTQTFKATFTMPAPADTTILPGMTVSVLEELDISDSGAGSFLVPVACVGMDGEGEHFVWRLDPIDPQGRFTVEREVVTVGPLIEDQVLVESGLKAGEMIAAAGLYVLVEGQTVTIMRETGSQ